VRTLNSIDYWLTLLRPVLETLYYIAAIALAIFAFKGLEQLKITKEIAKTNAKRESFKLAAEECRYFAEKFVPLSNALHEKCATLKLNSFSNPTFEMVNGEIASHNFAEAALAADFQKCSSDIIACLNCIEAFAIFFAAGIAEESVAYRETGMTFCSTIKKFMPAIYMFRKYGVRYESTVTLYKMWSDRIASEALLKARKTIDNSLRDLKTEGIKPIGTD
jgi:hypothetical protein